MKTDRLLPKVRLAAIGLAGWVVSSIHPLRAAAVPEVGDLVRLTRGETLMANGKKLAQASKGQEFTLLKREPGAVALGFMKEDGSVVAGVVPTDAIESVPTPGWESLVQAMRAFRDQQYDAAKTHFARAVQDPDQKVLAGALAQRVLGAVTSAGQAAGGNAAGKQALINTVTALRDGADQLAKAGRVSLAAAMDEGAERLAAATLGAQMPPTRVDRADLAAKAATADRAYIRARQAVGMKRLLEARRLVDEGLGAEPAHPGLKALQPGIKRGISDAEELYETANKMKRFEKGAVHALSAIDDGLKICSDHPRLRTLRSEMSAQFEERTSPQVTPAFLATAKVQTSKENLETGRTLYTNRCAECHDLEMLDSRSLGGWDRMVSGMARRANLNNTEKDRIMDYLAAALKVVESGGQ